MTESASAAIRAALDAAGHAETGICAYSAKYASAFYGPFREAAEGAPSFGDRASHQQDPANAVEASQVRGEFAMVEAAAANGWLDRDRAITETLTAIRRAGATVILTYWAAEVAGQLGR